jgi:hypothetical protein
MSTDLVLSDSLTDLFSRSEPINYREKSSEFVRSVFQLLDSIPHLVHPRGYYLAALFDLSVTALYLEKVATSGWYYCDNHQQSLLVYPFVNACPACTLSGNIRHLKARKPQSASIGKSTSTILAAFLDQQAKSSKGVGFEILTVRGNEMVDAYLKGPNALALLEIKSAPLIAFPLQVASSRLTEPDSETGECAPKSSHSEASISPGQAAHLLIDSTLSIPVGDPHKFSRHAHYDKILSWLSTGDSLEAFVSSWIGTFQGYGDPTKRSSTHWMTNGCGTPNPRPADWPLRAGQGFETVSDGKSSVGLDRTDDLKKGIYQVLKISTHYKEFFPNQNYAIFAALATNIHAVKHRDEYLGELEDLVWTVDGPEVSHVVARDDMHTVIKSNKLYNLFDAVISFTEPHFRAPVLEEVFDFNA